MTEPLPDNIDYCTITGRIGESTIVDGEHIFVPGVELILTFRAVPVLYDPMANPAPVIIVPRDQILRTDSGGYVVDDEGNREPTIISTTDADLTPNGWTYAVKISGAEWARKIKSFSLVAPAGEILDLGAYIGTTPSPGHTADTLASAIAQAVAAAAAAAQSAADAAESAEEAAGGGGGGAGGPIVAGDGDITDATALAVNIIVNGELPADIRTLIGAGTSNVAIGTASGTAADAAVMTTALALKADASAVTSALLGKADIGTVSSLASSVVTLTGGQNINGIKTFLDGIAVPDGSIPTAKLTGATDVSQAFLAAAGADTAARQTAARAAINAASQTDLLLAADRAEDAYTLANIKIGVQELSDALDGFVSINQYTADQSSQVFVVRYNGTSWGTSGDRPVAAGSRMILARGGPAQPPWLNAGFGDWWVGAL